MSRFDDDSDEMARFPDDAEVDRLLSGNGAPEGWEDIALFVEATSRFGAGGAPAPNAALAQILANGLSLPHTPVDAASSTVAPRRSLRRKIQLGIAELLASLGMGAKAALGLGVAASAVTAAGVAGVLPDPVQHAVSRTVDATTPFEVPDSSSGSTSATSDASDDTATEASDASDASDVSDAPDDHSDAGTPDDNASFGQSVASDARDGGVDGQSVASQAKEQGKDGQSVAGDTPAGDHVPTSVPVGAGDGSGHGPSGDHAPVTPETQDDASSHGSDAVSGSPAASHRP